MVVRESNSQTEKNKTFNLASVSCERYIHGRFLGTPKQDLRRVIECDGYLPGRILLEKFYRKAILHFHSAVLPFPFELFSNPLHLLQGSALFDNAMAKNVIALSLDFPRSLVNILT
ncbi:hypothetical protein TNIN_125771 [Trichonephila inaurata madagascariensis]|uniref:Uncharacterized protein n=1 Tax=Trichonephila inaurata madagascariensis TaxID=2747483 RepID=A0A8X6XVP1_9ARAC|nr:hypothetical protein TNIN_125771 [Trichonephila inaurata madagascariensis]